MRNTAKFATTAFSLAALFATATWMPLTAQAADDSAMEAGKKLAFDRKKGNCLACHSIAGGDSPGNIGPPLVAMKARFPDRAKLREKIWDATASNPDSPMLPFGKNKILNEKELDLVVDFIHSL